MADIKTRGQLRNAASKGDDLVNSHGEPNVGTANPIMQDKTVGRTNPSALSSIYPVLMDGAKSYGQKLRELRNAKGVAQAVVAEAVGISRPHYTNIEKGRDRPSLEIAVALADYYGVGMDFIHGMTPVKSVVLNEFEQLLIEAFRRADDSEAKTILKMVLGATRPPSQ